MDYYNLKLEKIEEDIKTLKYCLGIGDPNNSETDLVYPVSFELNKIRELIMSDVSVVFEATHRDAIIPSFAYEGDACFDLFAVEDTIIPPVTFKTVTAELDKITDQTLLTLLSTCEEPVLIRHDGSTLPYHPDIEVDKGNFAALQYKAVDIGKAFVPVGLKMELPPGWEATFRTRSSFGVRNSLRIHPGTIDAGYRGDLAVAVYNMSSQPHLVKKGTGVAQVAIRPVPKVRIIEGQVDPNTQRGEKGFGSSDKV